MTRSTALTALTLSLVLALAGSARAADTHPCGAKTIRNEGQSIVTQICPMYIPSGSSSVPVVHFTPARKAVGKILHGGDVNWFVCQAKGRRGGYGRYHNVWWALTLSDDHKRGWLNESFFQGGGNDQRDAGLRRCGNADFAWGNAGGAGNPGSTAPSTPKPTKPKPNPSACTRVINQHVRIDGVVTRKKYWESYGVEGGGHPSVRYLPPKQTYNPGYVVVTANTCRSPYGHWRVLSPIAMAPHYSNLNSKLEVTGDHSMGFGLVPRRFLKPRWDRPKGGVRLQTMECSESHFLGWLHELLAVPLPKVNYFFVVGEYVAGAVLGDGSAECDTLADVDVPFGITRHGRLYARRAGNALWYVLEKNDGYGYQIKVKEATNVRQHGR